MSNFLGTCSDRLCFCPGQVWNDCDGVPINAHGGGILFHDGIYFWFGEHKIEGRAGNYAQVGVRVYSSRDLYHWKNEGVALSVVDEPTSLLTRGCILERPKVIYNSLTRQFVMWFHLEPIGKGYSGALSGVAVSECPTGPYRFVGAHRPNAGRWPTNVSEKLKCLLNPSEIEKIQSLELAGGPVPYYPKQEIFRRDHLCGQMARDMALFVDDDGVGYQIYSSEENGTLHISQLTDDYLRSAGKYVRLFPGRFHEAPAIMKRRDKYFLITSDCTGWTPNAARVSVADSIWGPWEELGNPCLGTGNQIVNTFCSQPTFLLRAEGIKDGFIFMADRWQPDNAIDGRYVWLPVQFLHGVPTLRWLDQWGLNFFNKEKVREG